MTTVIPMILCGGSGTRLWPLSRSGFPKQFLVLSGNRDNKTFFHGAEARLNQILTDYVYLGETVIVTNEDYRFLVLDQLREMNGVQATLLLEPAGRNTAPALIIASLYVKDTISDGMNDPILVVTPAYQTIQDKNTFTLALQNCISLVADDASKKLLQF